MSQDRSLCLVQARKICLGESGDKHNIKELLFFSLLKETFTQEADPLCISDSRGGGAAPT